MYLPINSSGATSISLANAGQVINLKAGEKFRLKFNYGNEDANEVIKVTSENSSDYYVSINGHDIKASNRGSRKFVAQTGSGATYDFVVNVITVDKLEVAAKPAKVVYYLGEELDLAGLVIQSLYSDESLETITDYTITGFDSTRPGKNIVEVGWADLTGKTHTATFELEIVDPNANPYDLGDANLDGTLNIKDATSIQKNIAGLEEFTEQQKSLADFNADTVVNIKDATAIQKKIAGLI